MGNREEAWDLSQEAFAKAYRSLRSYRGEGDFKAWLMRITANQCKDYFKKRRLPTVSLQSVQAGQWATGTSADPAQAAQQAEMDGAIRSALAKLPEKHRRAFVLREFEGLSYAKMAEVMGCNVGTVMSRLHHARRKMRSLLTAMGMGVVEEKTDD